jgi:hypothetical protein
MAFVMPATMPIPLVPSPKDSTLKILPLSPGRFVVYRYTGFHTKANETQALNKLLQFVAEHQLHTDSKPLYGYYNPPWTLPFLRRNEVMLRLNP